MEEGEETVSVPPLLVPELAEVEETWLDDPLAATKVNWLD